MLDDSVSCILVSPVTRYLKSFQIRSLLRASSTLLESLVRSLRVLDFVGRNEITP